MARDYCCCAIPIVNFGIYTTLVEQFVVGIVAGTLAIATPKVVSYSAPSFGPWIFAAACYLLAATQIFGFIGVRQERAIWFRRYTTLHGLLTLVVFSVAAVFIGISASQHNNAKNACEKNFFSTTADPTGQSSDEGDVLCNIFAWVGIGLMGGLWIILAIMQGYLFSVLSSYGSSQQADHDKYYSTYSSNDIALGERSKYKSNNADPWDARQSTESLVGNEAGIGARGRSMRSGPAGYAYEHARQDSFGLPPGAAPPGGHSRKDTMDATVPDYATYAPPQPARVADENPTPGYGSSFRHERKSSAPSRGELPYAMQSPEQSMPHPAEGSFGRKTPRVGEPYPFAPQFQQSSDQYR